MMRITGAPTRCENVETSLCCDPSGRRAVRTNCGASGDRDVREFECIITTLPRKYCRGGNIVAEHFQIIFSDQFCLPFFAGRGRRIARDDECSDAQLLGINDRELNSMNKHIPGRLTIWMRKQAAIV